MMASSLKMSKFACFRHPSYKHLKKGYSVVMCWIVSDYSHTLFGPEGKGEDYIVQARGALGIMLTKVAKFLIHNFAVESSSQSQIRCLTLEDGGGGYSECGLNNRFSFRNIPISPKSSGGLTGGQSRVCLAHNTID